MSKKEETKWPKYLGPTDHRKMSKQELAGYRSWANQRNRCNCVTNKNYKYYGAKGIQVEYSSIDFLGWWIFNSSKFPENMRLTVDRIDSEKNYSFDNIRMVSQRDNTLEMISRNIHKIKKRNSKPVIFNGRRFESATEAAKNLGVSSSLVMGHCNGYAKSKRLEGMSYE